MQVGTTINLCDKRPADSRAAKWHWNAAPKMKLVEKRKLSSLASPEMLVILLPRSLRRRRAEELRTPRISTAIGSKTKRLYLRISPPSVKQQSLQPCLLHELPRTHMTLPEDRSLWRPSIVTCRSATGWVKDRLPESGRFPSDRNNPHGSLVTGILAEAKPRATKSLRAWCLAVRPELSIIIIIIFFFNVKLEWSLLLLLLHKTVVE